MSEQKSTENSSDVWEQIGLFPNYNAHFILVHSPDSKPESLQFSKFEENIRKFAYIFRESFHLNLNVEHFWDISIKEFWQNLADKNAKKLIANDIAKILIENRHIPTLATEIDRFSTPSTNPAPLIKIALIENEEFGEIRFQDPKLVRFRFNSNFLIFFFRMKKTVWLLHLGADSLQCLEMPTIKALRGFSMQFFQYFGFNWES